MVVLKRIIFLCVLIGCQLVTTAHAAAVARVDRSNVFLGDTVLLQVEIDQQNIDTPNFSALQKDFELLGTTSSTQMNLSNGIRQVSTRWTIQLEPKREGNLVIPALRVGSSLTQPIRLNITERQQTPGNDREVFVEMVAEPLNPYVQQEVYVVVRLYHALTLTEGSLSNPTPPSAVVETLTDDLNYRTSLNGKDYRVIERRFVLFPERSGEMEIPAVQFSGRVNDNNQRDRFNSVFRRGRRVNAVSEAINLKVQPQPASFSGQYWLPAKELTLKESWPQAKEFKVGESVTRTITIESKGLLSVQLPELQLEETNQFKVYPDQPQSRSRGDGSSVRGSVEQKYAVVPTTDGRIILPEIRVPWWDTTVNQERVAVIPQRELLVSPAQVLPLSPTQTAIQSQSPVQAEVRIEETAPYWRWATIGLFFIWLATLLFWYYEYSNRNRKNPTKNKTPQMQSVSARQARSTFRQACEANQPGLAASHLLSWVAQTNQQSPMTNLSQLAMRASNENQSQMLFDLDRMLYQSKSSDSDELWQGTQFWNAFKDGVQFKSTKSQIKPSKGILPPLYPT